MSDETFIGRTITGIERPISEHGEWEDDRRWLLRLDDGTAVEFAAEGYEIDETTVTHLTEEVLRQRAIDAEADRLEREEQLARTLEARERARVHMDQMRGQLDPEAFEKWRRKTYPTLPETLKEVWSGPSMQEQFAASPILSRFKR